MQTTQKFDAALLFASWLHRDQKRKRSQIPYLSHLLAVSALVMEDGGTEEEAIAALLHDTVEDGAAGFPGGRPALRDYIRANFGERVLEIVNGCTDDDGHPKQDGLAPEQARAEWYARKREYLRHLEELRDPGVRRVVCADKLHNARCVVADYAVEQEKLWDRFRTRSAEDQIWYVTELRRIFGNESRLAEQFGAAALELSVLGGRSGQPAAS